MRTWMQALLLCLVLLLGNQNTCTAHANYTTPGMAEEGVTSGYCDDEKSIDHIYEDTVAPAQRQTALITDNSQNVRLCNTRPQRILSPLTRLSQHICLAETRFKTSFIHYIFEE